MNLVAVVTDRELKMSRLKHRPARRGRPFRVGSVPDRSPLIAVRKGRSMHVTELIAKHEQDTGEEENGSLRSRIETLKAEYPDIRTGMASERARQSISHLLKTWRKEAGLTQTQVAEMIGTSQKQISRMESCMKNSGDTTIGMVARFAHVCGYRLDFCARPITGQPPPLDGQC